MEPSGWHHTRLIGQVDVSMAIADIDEEARRTRLRARSARLAHWAWTLEQGTLASCTDPVRANLSGCPAREACSHMLVCAHIAQRTRAVCAARYAVARMRSTRTL